MANYDGTETSSCIQVDIQELAHLIDLGYTRKQLSQHFDVSLMTISRNISRHNLRKRDMWSPISDVDLDRVVQDATRHNPEWGEKMVEGYLLTQHIKVQRGRIRSSLQRVDSEGVQRRKLSVLHRREYRVAGPNALWHIDGNHKLIRWRLVIHGCIDGYSRLITFLRCSANNRASTVLEHFKEGVTEFGLPQRVRSDKGGENVEVCQYMLEKRGHNNGCFITGRSVHNQRIERLWKDVFTSCTSRYYECFYGMEESGLLDVNNEIHLFCLHYVFLPSVNHSLTEFKNVWKHHKIRTEGNKSPLQLWMEGILQGYPVDDLEREEVQAYGVEGEDEEEDHPVPGVPVPEMPSPLNEEDTRALVVNFPVDPEQFNNMREKVMYYKAVVDFVENKCRE